MPVFDLSLVLAGQYHDMLVSGFVLSLQITGITLLLALPLAMLIALLRVSPMTGLRAAGWLYVESIRNVPLLAHLLFWYFAAPELLPESLKLRLYEGNIEASSAVVALTLYSAAYMAEDIRSGIRSVPGAQREAGRALGMSFAQSMRFVILPQAVRITIPPLISQVLNLWKDTSVATVIGVAELMYQAAKVETATFRSLEAFLFATVAYLAVSLVITGLAAVFQRNASGGIR
jgi:polar amino acid transport system permease protein